MEGISFPNNFFFCFYTSITFIKCVFHKIFYDRIESYCQYSLEDICTSSQGIITGCDKAFVIDKNDNKSNAETIAKETGAKIYELDSGLTGNLDKNAYLNAMEQNFIRFKTCP